MTDRYDCIVVGVGGMGSAAVYRLAERGLDVLGLERYDVPHAMGSSHGSTRIVRLTQPEGPEYVPLARAAFDRWRDLERATGRDLLTVTGSVHAGPPGSDIVADARDSLAAHGVGYETLTGHAVTERFPGYSLPDDFRAVYQSDGGFVDCERAVCAHVEAAHGEGATVRAREAVESWVETADGVRVETAKGRYEADHLVVTAGAWNGDLLPSLADALTPVRAVMAWFQPRRPDRFRPDAFPVWVVEDGEEHAYGFPTHDVPGFKLGCAPRDGDPPVDPDTMAREPTREDERRNRAFAERYFPDGTGPTLRLTTCIYTESPDEDFVLGPHPDHDRVQVAAGFSGRGFKFTAVVGDVLADLVTEGETDLPVEPHAPARLL